MGIILENALLCDLDPPRVEHGALRIDGGMIVQRGEQVDRGLGDERVDCQGAVVLPGLVNGHSHLYSSLATGMPAPARAPQDFLQILQYVWWRLDQALDRESNRASATIGALDALRCGTTTVIDHHSSPQQVADSLDQVETGIETVGLRGVLCYETTDRHGEAGSRAGLEENHRYLEKRKYQHRNQFAGMVGGHAPFTLSDETLTEMARFAEHFGVGVHIHVAEDECEEEICQQQHQTMLIDRLMGSGLVREGALFAHGVHLDVESLERLARSGVAIAHNPRSNMNNSVGYGSVVGYGGMATLGTDGIGSDMFAEAKTAYLIARDMRVAVSPNRILQMLANSARCAGDMLDVPLGTLEPESAGDVVITDYVPATPMTSENLAGHFLFGLDSRYVRDVIVAGQWLLRDRQVQLCNETDVRARASETAEALWCRMEEIPLPEDQ